MKHFNTSDLDELQIGTTLKDGAYQLNGSFASNSFGIQYYAETKGGTKVVVKEFYPKLLCVRQGQTVVVRADEKRQEFNDLFSGFRKTADTLEALDNPNIAKLLDSFEENGTAYMVMEAIEGHTLQNLIETGFAFTPENLYGMLVKLLKAIHAIHAVELLHRDIQPKNIFVRNDLEPFLYLDFGTLGDKPSKETRAVSKVISMSNHYAALEIRSDPEKHAPAADIYSLAACFYYAISGTLPVPAIQRISKIATDMPDPQEPLSDAHEGYKVGVLETIDLALSAFQDQRIRSASEWLTHLNLQTPESKATKVESLYRPTEQVQKILGLPKGLARRMAMLGAFGAILSLLVLVVVSAR